jgi:hypothetical protein
MRCYQLLAGTLLSVAVAFAQAPGTNIIPDDAVRGAVNRAASTMVVIPNYPMNAAVGRALNSPKLPPLSNRRTIFVAKPPLTTCAVPLLEAHGKKTNDRMARPTKAPEIDLKMAVAPPIPACPGSR